MGEGRDGGEKHSAGLLAALLSSALRVWRARQLQAERPATGSGHRSGSVPGIGPMLFTLEWETENVNLRASLLGCTHAGVNRRPDRRGLSSVSVTLVM